MYLYSMEFGSFPLYAELNRVTRVMDGSELENLGPLAQAMNIITKAEETRRKRDDF